MATDNELLNELLAAKKRDLAARKDRPKPFTIGGKGKHAHVYGLVKMPRQRSYRFVQKKAKGGFVIVRLSQSGTKLLARNTLPLFAEDYRTRQERAAKKEADRRSLPKDRKARSVERKTRRQQRLWMATLFMPAMMGMAYLMFAGQRKAS